jgi:hypothetical protein
MLALPCFHEMAWRIRGNCIPGEQQSHVALWETPCADGTCSSRAAFYACVNTIVYDAENNSTG